MNRVFRIDTPRGAATVATVVLVCAAGVTFFAVSGHRRTSVTAQQTPSAVTAASILARVGITPETLAAVGATAEDTTAIVAAAKLRAATESVHPTFQSAADALAAAKGRDRDHRLAASKSAGVIAAPEVSVKQAEEAYRAFLADARASIATALTNNQNELLGMIAQNHHRQVPLQYQLITRSEAQWLQIRNAVSAKSIALRKGQAVPQGVTAVLATFDAEELTSAAASGLATQLASIKAAWNAAMVE